MSPQKEWDSRDRSGSPSRAPSLPPGIRGEEFGTDEQNTRRTPDREPGLYQVGAPTLHHGVRPSLAAATAAEA
jgi:hypothetical protein